MRNGQLLRIVLLACFLPFSASHFSSAQNCDPGADGVTPVGGGATQVINGEICANKMDMVNVATMDILYTNVDDGGNPNAVEFFIDWDDGTTETLFFSAGEITQPGFPPNSYQATVTHMFPATGGAVQCEYIPEVFLQFSGVACPGTIASPPPYVRWNTDNELTGNHLMAEQATGVVTFPVCAGDSFPVFFSDQSTFNCVPPAYNNLINNRERWTQFEYGTTNTITSATGVQVGGVVMAYPFLDGVANQVQPVTVPFAVTQDITVPSDASVGEEFEITMYSWNFCNQFGVDPPIVTTARILIIASPPPPVAPPTDFCVGAPVSVTVAGTGGTFDWYTDMPLSNNVFTGNPFDPTSDPPMPADRLDNSFENSRTYYVTETLGNNCVGPATAVTFNVYDNPTPSNAGGDFAVCAATAMLSGNPPVIGSGMWTASGPGNVVAGQEILPNANIENLVAGTTTTFTWTITNGGICISADAVDVTRDLLPSPADAGPDISLCTGTSAILMATAPAIGIGTWTITAGPGSIAPAQINNPNATVTGLVPGLNTTIDWEVVNGTCTPPAIAPNIDQVEIINFLDPPADAGIDNDVCAASAVLAATVPPAGSGLWTILAPAVTTETFVDDTDPTTTINGLVAGTVYTLDWTVTNGVCVDSDQMTLTRSLPPDPAVAGPPQNVCADNATLAANAPISGSGLWTVTAGSGTFVDDTDPGTMVTGLGLGANTFTWTISNACGMNSDNVIITNDNPTTADAGINQNVCGTGTIMLGNIPMVGTGLWTEEAGDGFGVFVDDTDPNTVFNGTVETTYTVRWTITNGVCPDSFSEVDIEFDANPTPSNAGPPQTLCGSSTALAGNTPGIGNGIWTEAVGDGLGTFVDDTDPTTTFNGTAGITYTLDWTISNGACLPSTTSVIIQFDADPTAAFAGGDQIVCGSSTNLGATPLIVGTGLWTEIAGDGLGAYVDNTSPTTLFTGTSGVTYTLRWTTSNGVCASTQDDVTIQFDQMPTPSNAGPDQTLCAASTPLAANTPVIGTGAWSEIAGDGLGNFALGSDPTTTFSGTAGVTYTLRWSITNGVCLVSEDDVVIQFDDNPDLANAGSDQTVCGTGVTLAGNAPSVGSGLWSEVIGDGLGFFTDNTDPTTGFTGTAGVTYTLRWTISNGICADTMDDTIIQLDEDPTPSNAGADQDICGTTTLMDGNNPTVGTGFWTFLSNPDGLGALGDPNLFNSTLDGTAGETYDLRWTISNGVCLPSFDDVSVTFNPSLPITTISGDTEVCVGDIKTYVIPGGNPTFYDYTWDITGLPPSTSVIAGSGTPFQFISLEFFDPQIGGILSVTTEDKATGCVGLPEILTITIQQTPVMSLVSSDPDLTICENDPVTFTATDALGLADFFEFQLNGSTVQSGASNVYTTTLLPTINSVVVIGTSPGGACSASSSPPIIHTVNPIPASFNVQGGGAYCEGGSGVTVGLDGSEAAITYELYLDGAPTGVIETPGGGSFDFSPQTAAGTYTVRAETLSTCADFMIGNTAISINPAPLLFNITGGGDFCQNDPGVSIGLDNSEPGINYQLYRNGVPQGAALPGNASALDFGLNVVAGDYEIIGTNPGTFCMTTMTGAASVNPIVVPSPVISNFLPEICSGSLTDIDLNSSAGTTFTWTVTLSDPAVSGAAEQLNPQPIGTDITQTLVNPTADVQSVTYAITATGAGPTFCAGDEELIVVEVQPQPEVQMTGDDTICTGESTPLTFNIEGQVPFEVVYSDGSNAFTLSGIASNHIVNVSPTITTTYSVVSVRDANGCQIDNPAGEVIINVEGPEADFSTEMSLSGCGPLEVTFSNDNIQSGVTYEWAWGDGSTNTVSSDPTVTHTFQNNSTSTLSFTVTLTAKNTLLGCEDLMSQAIEVFPSITASVEPGAVEGCSPVMVAFENNSVGVTDHRWYYRIKGTTDEVEVNTSRVVSYNLTNTGLTTLTYEVVYEASNGFCDETIVNEIVVFPELAPSFTVSANPVEVTNTPHVTVTNTTPNKAAWTYLWDWGDGTSSTEVDPGSHTYVDEIGIPVYGTFPITLSIFFSDTQGACESSATIDFDVVPVIPQVDFAGDILEGCRPLTVQFENLSVGVDSESVMWEFIGPSGDIEGLSNLYDAKFTFHNAGIYTIRLTGGNALGLDESETKEMYVTVHDLPNAGFTLRPDIVYLPDGTMFTENTSIRADEYFWIFNYQDYAANDGNEANLTSNLFEPQVVYIREGYKDIMLVAVNTATGCADSLLIEQAVFIDNGGVARVPNAFTPNRFGPSDGGNGSPTGGRDTFNETFNPVINGLSSIPGSFHMLIFDRWGNMLFETWDRNQGWNGYDRNNNLLPLGVYVYKLDLRFEDGSSTIRIGDVTLIR